MDELQFLQEVERSVQLIRSYLPHKSPVTASNLATTLKVKLDDRITQVALDQAGKQFDQNIAELEELRDAR